jgi:hypothetical protein
MVEYRHTPQITLLTLLPSKFDDKLRALISHHGISDKKKPKYEVLSYAHDETESCASIEVLDEPKTCFPTESRGHSSWHTISIPQDLGVALRYLRLARRRRTFWVDGIPIDQTTDKKKSERGARIKSILENAKQVVVWLGVDDEQSALAIRRMAIIAKDLRTRYTTSGNYYQMFRWKFCNTTRAISNNREAQLKIAHEWVGIDALLRRPWFTRLGAYQVIHQETKTSLVVGHNTISLEHFIGAFRWISRQVSRFPEGSLSTSLDRRLIWGLFEVFHLLEDETLTSMLIKTKELRCQDERERLHVVAPFIRSANFPNPKVTSTAQEMYRDWTLAAIRQEKSLSILDLCPFQESIYPSWALGPSYTDLPTPITYYGAYYQAGGNAPYDPPPCILSAISVDEATFCLPIQGKFIGDVKHITPACPLHATKDDILHFCRSLKTNSFLSSSLRRSDTSELVQALANTLVCNYFHFRPKRLPTGHLIGYSPSPRQISQFCTSALSNIVSGDEVDEDVMYRAVLQDYLPGRGVFQTEKGDLGLCATSVREGDRVFVAVGKASPLVLRKIEDRSGSYRLVGGECYVYGMMNLEAFLGPLPGGWRLEFRKIGGVKRHVYSLNGQRVRQEDPRLGPLPTSCKA